MAKALPIAIGIVLGGGAVLLSLFGNPANTGICVSCFMENTAGALGLHGNIRMQYIRPELIGFVLGAFCIALFKKDFKATSNGGFVLKFFVGVLLVVGCAVFMGCPIKMILRLAAGDLTAIAGVLGLIGGVFLGLKFVEGGFQEAPSIALPRAAGFLLPGVMVLLLAASVLKAPFILSSLKGAGAQRAPFLLSLGVGLIIGALAQRTKFCITAGIARVFVWGPREILGCPKTTGALVSIGVFFAAALVASFATGQFNLGIHGQPSSNESYVWGFVAMGLVGFGSVLIRGCPFRQLVLSGSGDTDAGGAVLGMLAGGALVQNFELGGNAAGTPLAGKLAVLIGLATLLVLGAAFRTRVKAPD